MNIADKYQNKDNNWKAKLNLIFNGFFMGTADVIPGVSGGTIALIIGIYEELIDTISKYDGEMLGLVWKRKWRELYKRMNLGFIFPLVLGIILAIFSLARLMTYLLSTYQDYTYAVFFGLIFGSVFIMGKDLQRKTGDMVFVLLGAVFTFGLVGFLPVETPKTLLAFFLSALLAICAMILPGISGSFILLLLGKYNQVMEVVKSPFSDGNIWYVLVFGLGAIIGIIAFSKLLKWLLQHYYSILFAFLVGMMIGSLRKLWPFAEIENLFSLGLIWRLILIGIGGIIVFLIHKIEVKKNLQI